MIRTNVFGRTVKIVVPPEGWDVEIRDGRMNARIIEFQQGEDQMGFHFHPDPDYPMYLQVSHQGKGFELFVNGEELMRGVSATLEGGKDIEVRLEETMGGFTLYVDTEE